jgi:haloalkane dehalogenase
MTTLATRNTQDTTTEGTLFVAFALSLRVIMPHAYTDKGKLTPHVHRQYVARFPDRWSRGAVLWALAQALLGSSRYYDALWQERAKLRGRPALLVWGMQEPALQAHQLARWRDVLPSARVVEFDDVGHWPHEEAPTRVINAMRDFLSHNNHFPAGHGA